MRQYLQKKDLPYNNVVFASTPESREGEREEIRRKTEEFLERGGVVNADVQNMRDKPMAWNGCVGRNKTGIQPETLEKINKIMVMSAKGVNKLTICERMGLSRSTVNRYVKEGIKLGLGGGFVKKYGS